MMKILFTVMLNLFQSLCTNMFIYVFKQDLLLLTLDDMDNDLESLYEDDISLRSLMG